MGKGVLYKSNGASWSKSQATKSNGASWSQGKVRHSDGASWYDNFPMEQTYEAYFGATYTQGYYGNGTALYNGTFWEHDLVVGDPDNFRSVIGFNQGAIQNFINGGRVIEAFLILNLKQTSTNGKPDVQFGKHNFGGEPGAYYGEGDWGNNNWYQFPNKAYGGYWVPLKPETITLVDGRTAISGITMQAASATAEDMGRFNGTTTYNTQLFIKVVK